MHVSIPATELTHARCRRPEIDPGTEHTGPLLAASPRAEGRRRRLSTWADARAAAADLVDLDGVGDGDFSKRVVQFSRAHGFLLSGFEPTDSSPDQVRWVAERASSDLGRFLECVGSLRIKAEILADQLEADRSSLAVEEASGSFSLTAALAGRHWWARDLTDARLDELRNGDTWRAYERLVDRLRAFFRISRELVEDSSATRVFEPVALHRLTTRVVADLAVADAPFRDIEAGLTVVEAILSSQVELRAEPGPPPAPPVPIVVRIRPRTWLGAILLSALVEGPGDFRRCSYRNCQQTFPVKPRQKRFCSEGCRNSESVYQSRERRS